MNKQQCLNQWIAALALAGFLVPVAARAQDDAESRAQAVTLASEAISAKESGDLVTAKAKLEQVVKLNPADQAAKDLLKEVDQALLAGGAAKSQSAIDRVAEENLNLFREVDSAMLDAQSAAASKDFDGAIALLDQAAAALPVNTAGQQYKDRVTLLRQQILAARDSQGQGGVKKLADLAIAEQLRNNKDRAVEADKLNSEAQSLVGRHRFDDAEAALDKADVVAPPAASGEAVRAKLRKTRSALLVGRYQAALEASDIPLAAKQVEAFEALNGKDDSRSVKLRADFAEKRKDPHYKNITEVSPNFAFSEKKADELLIKARAQYLYGDYLGALETYKDVLQYQPYNTEAKSQSIRIRDTLHEKSGRYNSELTKGKLLEDVEGKWATPESFSKEAPNLIDVNGKDDPVLIKMKKISIPSVSLRDMKLDRVIEELGVLSVSYDPEGKGVNFNLIDPDKKNPEVSLTIRNMPLDRVLEQVLRSAGFGFVVNNGVVEVRPETGNTEVETEFFPLSNGAVTRMTGGGAAATTGNSPFGGGGAGAGAGGRPEVEGLIRYFRALGMEFSQEKGEGLNYDGQQLIVTSNRRTLDRVRNVLRRYSDVKQVAIEAKFLEVTQNALNQITTNWQVQNTLGGGDNMQGVTGNRTMDSAFARQGTSATGTVLNNGVNTPIPNNPPNVPGAPNFGSSNSISVFGTTAPSFLGTFRTGFGVGGYSVDMFVQALEQTTGSDLMAAPSLTVKDGQAATIKIAQLLRYPESYAAIQSQVSQSGGGGGLGGVSSAAVTITAGTPQDFTVQEVGVVMEVTPTVQADGESIELDLKPKITEFEGFVEYGGTSVAIAGSTTVTVPSGFYQPVFSIREVTTKVTVYDGATVVIGGLTREEVKSIHDKVPVLGDLPLVGKLFRSDGKTSSKKNLMIFVTANMISPTGSQLRGTVGGVRNGTTYQNPTLTTPSGPVYRAPIEPTAKAAPAAPAAQ